MIDDILSCRHSQIDDDANENVFAKCQAAKYGNGHFQGEPIGACKFNLLITFLNV